MIILPSLACADEWQEIERAAHAIHADSFQGNRIRHTQQGTSIYALSRIRENKKILDYAISLDGNARAIIRHRDRLDFYASSQNDLLRLKAEYKLFFPDILPNDIRTLKNFYFLHTKNVDRIAGKECRWVWLVPYDVWRYMQGFCLATHNTMPLAHIIKRSDGKIVQNDAFIRIDFRKPNQQEMRIPSNLPFKESQKLGNENTQKNNANTRITIPDGFILKAHNPQKKQYILTDGLVNISIFLEDSAKPQKEKAHALKGALSMAQITRNKTKITALGDMPPDGLLRLVRHLEFQ